MYSYYLNLASIGTQLSPTCFWHSSYGETGHHGTHSRLTVRQITSFLLSSTYRLNIDTLCSTLKAISRLTNFFKIRLDQEPDLTIMKNRKAIKTQINISKIITCFFFPITYLLESPGIAKNKGSNARNNGSAAPETGNNINKNAIAINLANENIKKSNPPPFDK